MLPPKRVWLPALGVLTSLTACAPDPPAVVAAPQAPLHFTDAPTPSNRYVIVRGADGASLAIPLRRSPANTQAVAVGPGAVRGAVASGLKEAF